MKKQNNYNNNAPRLISIWHGKKMWKTYEKINEETGEVEIWEKPYPSGGVRHVNVSSTCKDSIRDLALSYEGEPYTQEDWVARKFIPWSERTVIIESKRFNGKKSNKSNDPKKVQKKRPKRKNKVQR